MDNNQKFLQGLNAIRNTAALKQGTIAVSDILAAFPGVELSDEQIGLIYAYLEQESITLADYEPHDVNTLELGDYEQGIGEGVDPAREQRVFEMYQADLDQIAPLSSREEEALVADLLSGSPEARRQAAERLTEGNLRWVVRLAREQAGGGVPLSDLIQEGNLALWESIQAYEGKEELAERLEKDIKKAMKALIRESSGAEQAEDQMTLWANRIFETVQAMEEELNRPVTAAEIAAKTGIPEARVEAVLRESARAIKNEER